MTDHIETCPDNHHCFNGSICVENPYDEGSYYCDCDEVIWDVHYEGLFCEHKAEVYCNGKRDGVLKHWFCTNKGTCNIKDLGSTEPLCICPDAYEGSFCQFVKGTKPDGYPYNKQVTSTKASNSGPIVGAIIGSLVTLIVIGTVGAAIFYRRKNEVQKRGGGAMAGRDLEINADGALLKDAIAKSMQDAALEANTPFFRKNPNSPMRSPQDASLKETERYNHIERPNTSQSEGGLSYAEEEDLNPSDDSSMLSIT